MVLRVFYVFSLQIGPTKDKLWCNSFGDYRNQNKDYTIHLLKRFTCAGIRGITLRTLVAISILRGAVWDTSREGRHIPPQYKFLLYCINRLMVKHRLPRVPRTKGPVVKFGLSQPSFTLPVSLPVWPAHQFSTPPVPTLGLLLLGMVLQAT